MEKSLWKVKYVRATTKVISLNISLTVLQIDGHTEGILYKLPKKRLTKKTWKDIIKLLKDEVGALYIGSCIVDGDEDMIKKSHNNKRIRNMNYMSKSITKILKQNSNL